MSSGNRVRLTSIGEVTYGVTPAGAVSEMGFVSEDLSATPNTIQSATVRSDRMKGQQVISGLEVGGGVDFELSGETWQLNMMAAALGGNGPATQSITNVDATVSGTGTVLASTAGDLSIFNPLDIALLGAGWTDPANAFKPVLVTGAVTAASMNIAGQAIDEVVASGADIHLPTSYVIGTSIASYTLCKEFLDVADANARSLTFTGMKLSEMQVNINFGSNVTVRVAFAGNGYDQPTVPLTDGRTITAEGGAAPYGTAETDFGFIVVDGVAIDACFESVQFTLNNNLQAQNCVGSSTPKGQVEGSAAVSLNARVHVNVAAWDAFMAAKSNQTPMSFVFTLAKGAGSAGFAFVLPAMQVAFPDPASGGQDSTVAIDITGTASYDAATGHMARMYTL